MRIYFSPSEIGFYHESDKQDYLLAGTWPNDLIEISERWFQFLIDGQEEGKEISVNEYGQPVLVDPPTATKEQLLAEADAQKAALMNAASAAIEPLKDAVELGMSTDEEEGLLLAWQQYRVLLMRVDTSLAPDIEWPVLPA
ncbi:tail fiber assembly protein [Enterobacter sp. Z1]|uniref:tail fiber assembly protein n=1 Tax=Enterobacter sp. Z1 TaxID=2561927 RepID=UPI0011DF1047|nr:tail fiber assembly protein [Enterobacter sp. Z1]TYD01598.1 tail fiber assembly protein [Enterobacter sp. Z1]USX31041.1 tail fiber assembly protein [Enterobacter sp. Z1]